jgi:hypothetical protein
MADDETTRAPLWRNPGWIGAVAGVIGAIAAVVALFPRGSGGDGHTETGDPTTSVSLPTTTTSTPASGAALYWTSDGSVPARSQQCFGLLGTCLGRPIDAVSDDLGTESDRYAGEDDSVVRSWDLEDVGRVIFTTDSLDAIVEAHGTGSADFRLSIPAGRTLGEDSLADIVAVEGDPADVKLVRGEGLTIAIIAYCDGPEGSLTEEYSLDISWDESIESDLTETNVVDRLGDRTVTGYSVRLRGVSGVTATC